MAEVQHVQLDIDYPATGSGVAHVEVRSRLVFAAEDQGKDFALRIALFGSDSGEGTPQDAGSAPLHTFHFPRGDFVSIRAVHGTLMRVDTVDLDMAVLDEDKGYSMGYILAPLGDEIYAVVSLSAEARSNIVHMEYTGKPRVLTPIR